MKEIAKSLKKGFLAGLILSVVMIITMESFSYYYESDSYYESRKEFISENIADFEKGLTYEDKNYYSMDLSDYNYYEEVCVYSIDTDPYVIFWADREKLSDDEFWHRMKWRFISDTNFSLDTDKELDCFIIEKLEKL